MTLTLRSWIWARVSLNRTLNLYLSSYQIWIKSIIWFGKYELLKCLQSKFVSLWLDLEVIGMDVGIAEENLWPVSIIKQNMKQIHCMVWKIWALENFNIYVTLTLRSGSWVCLNKTLDLYLSSYQIWSKSIIQLENMISKHTLNLKFLCVWPWPWGITNITLNLYLSSYQI